MKRQRRYEVGVVSTDQHQHAEEQMWVVAEGRPCVCLWLVCMGWMLCLGALTLPSVAIAQSTTDDDDPWLRVGARGSILSKGSASIQVSGPGSPNINASTAAGYTDNTRLGTNLFGTWAVGRYLHLGGSLWYYPQYRLQADIRQSDPEHASALDLNLMVDVELPLGSWSLLFS
ncbi:MAG: hypothetical protein AAFX99_25155, partial [Myxococcota bacterium]